MSVKSFFSSHIMLFRVIAAVVAFALIGVLLWGANDLLGNPISYSLAKSRAEKYVAENYADEGYVLESVGYSFKFKDYLVHVAKPNSKDCYFTLYYDMLGNFRGESFASLVKDKENVRRRLDMEYRELVRSVLETSANPYNNDDSIQYGSLIFEGDEDITKEEGHGFGLPRSILVPDKTYNIAELGAQGGLLTFYADVDEATPEKAAEVLLDINTLMELGEAPFYAIDLRLISPNDGYYVDNFRRSDIYEDGLVERVKNLGLTTEEYNAKGETK